LVNLFDNSNITHKLLQFSPELNQNGYNLLFTAYEKGKSRMESLLKQEVYHTESRNTTGRRFREVNIYTYTQIQEIFTKKITKSEIKLSKLNPTPLYHNSNKTDSIPIASQSISKEGEQSAKKKTKRIVKDYEKELLDPLALEFLNSTPTDIAVNNILSHLDSTWERKDVLQYVRNRRR
ncbi:19164_t:CDS:1, partial [Funneliformis geosporum]